MTDPYYHGPERQSADRKAVLVAKLEGVLGKLMTDCDGVIGALVVTDDGFPVAQRFKSEMEPRRLAAITSSLLGLSESMAKETSQGKCMNAIVENEQGNVVMIRIDKIRILTAIATKNTRLGMLISSARKCAQTAADLS